jgi:hypothetical protein
VSEVSGGSERGLSFWPLRLYAAAASAPTVGWQAIGKVVQNLTYETNWLPSWELADWGYGKNKVSQLNRNYINEAEFERVRAILGKRAKSKYTSVALSLRGAPKDARSQGWCMLSLVISRYGDWSGVEVQYRTTELVLKFAADVWLLRKILTDLGIKPNVYRFRFANCALSGAYFPYLVDKTDLANFLEYLYRRDQTFFIRTTRFLLKSTYKEDQYHPFSPERLSHRYLWEHATTRQIKDIRGFLEPLHRATGRPLPKDFHDSSYIPKGQRTRAVEDDE